MANKDLKKYPYVDKLLGPYVNYAVKMRFCIVGMIIAWFLLFLTSILQLIITPQNIAAWIFMIVFVVILLCSRMPYKAYRDIYRTHMSEENLDTYETDLSANARYLKCNIPVAITKDYVYIAYRCELIRIACADIWFMNKEIDYTKKRFEPMCSLRIEEENKAWHIVPLLSKGASKSADEIIEVFSSVNS